jgi:hypothetical protein
LLLALALLCAAFTLPEYPNLFAPAFRVQTVCAVLVGLMALVLVWLPLPASITPMAGWLPLALLGVPLSGLWMILSALQALIKTPVWPGWGWWGTCACVLVAIGVKITRLLKFPRAAAPRDRIQKAEVNP